MHHSFRTFIAALLSTTIQSKVNHVPIPTGSRCPSTHYFDTAGLKCTECEAPWTPDLSPSKSSSSSPLKRDAYGNALQCTCRDSEKLKISKSCSRRELQDGTCIEYTCSKLCRDLRMAVSFDGSSCVSCGVGTKIDDKDDGANNGVIAVYDETIYDCSCSNPMKMAATGVPVSTRRLMEIYDEETAFPVGKVCQKCPCGTAVISENLYRGGDSFYDTAGKRYKADLYACVSCPDKNMYFDTDYNCVCKSNYTTVGEISIGEQHCIENIPSISNDYSKAEFYAIQTSSGASIGEITIVDSIIYSHLYLKAASECEYFRGPTINSIASCQTLGNLCALNLFDEEKAPCRQFQKIIAQKRDSSYNGQEDWKYSLPWLYYLDKADDITTDRGIDMKVSFSERQDHTHNMKFKLAKYSLDGVFVGFEDLTTHLSYCASQKDVVERNRLIKDDIFFAFGHSKRTEYSCDLGKLLDMETYFYDMYVVDEANDSCRNEEDVENCLYPVPVLHRNLVEERLFPNKNRNKDDEYDDKYTRRFFFFDNISGRSSSGVDILRYAKVIVLQITIQTENPSKIHPPRLMISYAERYTSGWKDAPHAAKDDIMFKIEFSMDTTNFWNAIEILLGFVSAVAGVMWLFRVYNWHNQNNRPMDDSSLYQTNNYQMNFIHIIMIACHTFVMVFAPFIFLICSYWFVFFKLQKEVFIMLPANNEFYGLETEYLFFNFFFYALFSFQTIYVGYLIYRQSRADIFFVDWERPKSLNSSVSIWRTVLIGNEWNKMQTRRKTCIEFSLMWLGFFLIGLNLYNNATTQPSLRDRSDGYINIALRFANTVWYWFIVSLAQWVWNFVFYERYWKEPPSQIFLDLCTVAKISLFVMDEPYHGYYLHCRSPYEFVDCSMTEILEQFKKEERGFTTDRGLDAPGAPPDCQVFEIFTSRVFQGRFDKGYAHLHHHGNVAFRDVSGKTGDENLLSRLRARGAPFSSETITHALLELNEFLQCFVSQSPAPIRNGLRYVVREPSVAERILGIAPADIQAKDSRCIFYPDQTTWIRDHKYLNATFLGIEADLLLHDILTFNVADLIFNNTAVSILVTYLMHLLRVTVRSRLGRANIAKKTLLDDRFLL